jgi:hypothetical protein
MKLCEDFEETFDNDDDDDDERVSDVYDYDPFVQGNESNGK